MLERVIKFIAELQKPMQPPTGEMQAEVKKAAKRTPKKVIVAVHGMGEQFRYATIQAVGRQFFRYRGVAGAVPLGALYGVLKRDPPQAKQESFGFLPKTPLEDLGLAEVYWADIPRIAVGDRFTLEETKSWAKTVVERLQLRHDDMKSKRKSAAATAPKKSTCRDNRRKTAAPMELARIDFKTIKQVLSEIIDTVRVLESLMRVLEKQTRLKFPLKQVLKDYLGDVEIVADYKPFRRKILDEFHAVLNGICDVDSPPEVYIVAHSEGTVVSFLALLEAMNEKTKGVKGDWVEHVRGFMTFGSPIDKHLILWPELFAPFEPDTAKKLDMGEVSWRKMRTIQWCNYYDFGDPVGFSLDTARDWLVCQARGGLAGGPPIQFLTERGFSRYYFPGKAHNDYWRDDAVFQDFIQKMAIFTDKQGRTLAPKTPKPLTDSWRASMVAAVLPYLLVSAVSIAGTYLLYKPTAGAAVVDACKLDLAWNVVFLGIALTLATAAARIPRLARARRWTLLSVFLLLLSLTIAYSAPTGRLQSAVSFDAPPHPKAAVAPCPCAGKPPQGDKNRSGCEVQQLFRDLRSYIAVDLAPCAALKDGTNHFVIVNLVIFAIGWLTSRGPLANSRRGAGLAKFNMIPMLVVGALSIIWLIAYPLLQGLTGVSLWPALLGFGAFLYLWWLAALLFDLSFIWHRYICNNAGLVQIEELSTGVSRSRDRDRLKGVHRGKKGE